MFALARIDPLIDQAAREIFDAPIDLAIDERCRHGEGDAGGEFLQHVVRTWRSVASRASARDRAHAGTQRVERLEFAEVLRELVVERRTTRLRIRAPDV